jgi:hypothetical protein
VLCTPFVAGRLTFPCHVQPKLNGFRAVYKDGVDLRDGACRVAACPTRSTSTQSAPQLQLAEMPRFAAALVRRCVAYSCDMTDYRALFINAASMKSELAAAGNFE